MVEKARTSQRPTPPSIGSEEAVERDLLDLGFISAAVDTSPLWQDVIYMETVTSTNALAKDLALRGGPEGIVVVAEEQTAGRGRLDRRWVAPPRSSLLISLIFRPDLQPSEANRLTMLCSMAAADAISQVSGLCVGLKWPNDLIIAPSETSGSATEEWRKLGGILTETGLSQGHLTYVVVGLGINVNVPTSELRSLAPNATSMMVETGTRVNRSALLVALLKAAETRYRCVARGEDPRREWSGRLVTLGRRVWASTPEGHISGLAEGVDEDGALLVRAEDGVLHRLVAADVSLADS